MVLPDTGLVFITGRSGSGKSTLLNQVGTLDKPTNGQIVFNGLELTSLNESKATKFRNDHVGFVFQDFALVESMNVYDNVAIALEVQSKDNDEYIDSTLKELDIYDLKDKKVTELSAGQKQRVAIARAVVKKPSLILADEPTGNLDREVGNLVLGFLKKVSSSCLVIVISHNQEDAYKYADRIIRLSEGKVVSDISTNEKDRNKVVIGDTIYLNDVKAISESEFEAINKDIKKDEIQNIRPIEDLFHETEVSNKGDFVENTTLSNNSLSSKKVGKLYRNFLLGGLGKTSFLSMVSMILISLFSLCIMLINFDSDVVYGSSYTPTTCYIKHALDDEGEEYDATKLGRIDDEDEKILGNYDDRYYIYSLSHPLASGIDRYTEGQCITFNANPVLYPNYSYGVAVIEQEQYKNIFGLDEITYLATSEEIRDEGIYITDYMADSFAYYTGKSYGEMLGKNSGLYINGIIKTDYLDRFKEEFEKAKELKNYSTSKIFDNYERQAEYCDWVHNYYGVSYSFNPNFRESYIVNECRGYYALDKAYLDLDGYFSSDQGLNSVVYTYYFTQANNHSADIGDDEILIPASFAKLILGQDLTLDELNEFFDSQDVKLCYMNMNGEEFSMSVKVRVHSHGHTNWLAGKNVSQAILSNLIYKCNVNIFGPGPTKALKEAFEEKGFSIYGTSIMTAERIDTIISSYFDLFKLIAIILLVASVLFIFYMSYDSVRKKKYDIGVLKAIGMPVKDLYKVYGLNILFQFLICSAFYVVFILLFKDLANGILLSSILTNISANARYINFDIFTYTNLNLLIDCSVILGSSLIGALIPIIKIKNIKPIDIVRCKY